MKSINTSLLWTVFFLFCVALTCVASPWLALGANWLDARWPDLWSEPIPFSRIFGRSFMIAAIILFFAGRRLLIPPYLKDLIVVRPASATITVLAGVALSLVSIASLLAVMTVADVYTPYFRLSMTKSASRFASAVVSGVFAGFIEEIFFRGLLFFGLYKPGRTLRAYLFANLFYSASHFVKPDVAYLIDHTDPLAGFSYLLNTLQPFAEPLELLPGIFGLFLIGVVLAYALARTGHLYLGIGLHAGWIIGLKMIRVFGDFKREDLGWLFGDTNPKIVSGAVTWIGVLLVGLAVRRITRLGSPLVTGQLPSTTA